MGGKTKLKTPLIISVFLLVMLSSIAVGGTIYVDADANGANNGEIWADAYNYLQDALADADPCDQIWVAEGTYTPDSNSADPNGNRNRDATFQLLNDVALYGGFPSGGGTWNDRDPKTYETILSGDLDGNDVDVNDPCDLETEPSRAENSYHVVTSSETDPNAFLDGFTITAGNANGPDIWTNGVGGGIYNDAGSPTVVNCTFIGNSASFFGGGMLNYYSSPTITNCTFIGNSAFVGAGMYNCSYWYATVANCTFIGNSAFEGGGMYNDWYCGQIVANCTFIGNSADESGGGMYNYESSPILFNCTFIGNSATVFGGGMYNDEISPTLTNCTFSGNSAYIGGGMFNSTQEYYYVTPTNCIIWGNIATIGPDIDDVMNLTTVTYSDIRGGYSAVGNIDSDPLLTPDGHLRFGSPCIHAGDPNYFVPNPIIPNDIDGEDRIMDGRVEIGADEFLDSDGDGLPNWWEQKYFGNPNTAEANADQDGDGLTNLAEYEIYSGNPNAPPYYVDTADGNDSYDGLSPTPQGGGVGPKATIQAGIDAAGDGDTVLVAAGTYTGAGNYELVYGSKSVVVRAPDGATIDCNDSGRAINFEIKATFALLEGFVVTGGNADLGGGLRTGSSRLMLKNCVLSGNSATDKGGGIYSYLSNVTFDSLRLQHNTSPNEPNAGLIELSNINLQGDLTLEAGRLDVLSSWFYGPGQINLALGATLKVTTDPNNPTGPTVIRCNISGPGIIQVDLGSELIIEGDAIINLAHETDPNLNGTIQCDGLLLVRDSVHLSNANIQVTRASFEGDVDISNSVITAEAGAPYGQFFIEDTVHITGNDIHADGDRYMDLDPAVFAGVIANNRIFVTITEGVGQARGGLLELRGDPNFAEPPCEPNEFFCQLDNLPVFDTNSWTIERLELVAGAKVNLTNRFDFGNGGLYEVMYVKNLVLGPNSLLNTAFNQLYYESLDGDPNSVRNEPLLGFSLSNIAFDNENEFITRVMHNNFIDPDPSPPDYTRIHIERVTGLAPDPNGMMRMCNLRDIDPGSPYYNKVINARAKGLFAKASEDEVVILFEYLFGTSDPNTELVVYLSDVPELLDPNDPQRAAHYIEVARLSPPPAEAGTARQAAVTLAYLKRLSRRVT